jgi:hypothetical protein
MRRSTSLLVLLPVVLTFHLVFSQSAGKPQVFEIDHPTVIAFFPSTAKSTKKDSDSLADFQLYTASARQPLESGGVDLQVVYTREFRVIVNGTATTFKPSKAEPGYYYVAPGRKPRIEFGVMNDTDMVRVAHEYFGPAMKE